MLLFGSMPRKMTISFPALAQFMGHLHPMLVHLPIGFLILLGILEAAALRPRLKHLTSSSRAILVATVPVTVASIFCGWLLAGNGDYDEHLLFWHRWLGVGIGAAAVVLLILHRVGWFKAYRAILAVTLVLVAVGGHFGGSLTHGSSYLSLASLTGTRETTRNPVPAIPLASQAFYDAAVQPVFAKYCVSCHGPDKSKGKLRLDSLDQVLKGGDSGPVFVAGEPSQSLLLKRLHLPLDDDDHMPPDPKPQPSAEQMALLEWWIAMGAPADKTVGELKVPSALMKFLESSTSTAP